MRNTASQAPRMPAAKPSAAGATPKEITSASESSSRPSSECWLRERATLPSNTSRAKAQGASAAARKKCMGHLLSMYSIARNTAATPQAALPRVRKSARWNSRIIEKWRGLSIGPLERQGSGFVPGKIPLPPVSLPMKYDEQSIKVLKGLEPVRARPGMYTRTDSPLHIVQEMIDNAADEALAGHAKHIAVTMFKDDSIEVSDDGRGIPVGPHPVEKLPTVEVVYTRLHAGGKFDKKGGGAYAFSGGLHGVGVSVTNALSKRLEVRVTREGAVYEIAFSGGETVEKLKKVGKAGPKESGTLVRAWPDGKYFDTGKVARRDLELLLRAKAVLLPGLKVTLQEENGKNKNEWLYTGGLSTYMQERIEGTDGYVSPFFHGSSYASEEDTTFAHGEGAEWAIA